MEGKAWAEEKREERERMEGTKENVFILAHQRIKVKQVVESRGRGTFINFRNSLTHSPPSLLYHPLLDRTGQTREHKQRTHTSTVLFYVQPLLNLAKS